MDFAKMINNATHDMHYTISSNHKIICTKGFPSLQFCKIQAKKLNSVVLGIGANIGTEQQILARFWHLLCFFALHSRIFGIFTSPIYQNPPFGYVKQAHFYNALITLSTSLSLLQIYGLVFYLERKFGRGRKREFQNAPRMLDIDIIFYNHTILHRKYLKIPHGSYHNRLSVLIPLLLQCSLVDNAAHKMLK